MSDNHRGRPRISVAEDIVEHIIYYSNLGLSYRKIKKLLSEKHETELTIYKIQSIIKGTTNTITVDTAIEV